MTDQKQDHQHRLPCALDEGRAWTGGAQTVMFICPDCSKKLVAEFAPVSEGSGLRFLEPNTMKEVTNTSPSTAPSSPPNELDSILKPLFFHVRGHVEMREFENTKSALEALIAHAVLEARQDELYKFKSAARKAQGLLGGHAVISAEAIRSQVNERLAELAAQKEKQNGLI